jgi:hypothetical protein
MSLQIQLFHQGDTIAKARQAIQRFFRNARLNTNSLRAGIRKPLLQKESSGRCQDLLTLLLSTQAHFFGWHFLFLHRTVRFGS